MKYAIIYIMRTLIFLLYLTATSLNACPIGMQKDTYGYGNIACKLDGHIKTIQGSLSSCPQGFTKDHDKWNNPVCFDGQIMAYDLSNGCPKNLTASWDAFGHAICLGFSGQPVVALVD
jgi:hypothetical protein